MKKFTFLFFTLFIGFAIIGQTNYDESFDEATYWAGGSMGSYNAKTYTKPGSPANDQFSTDRAVRESTNVHSSPYAWRVDDNGNNYLRYECEETISAFQVYMARWDNSPSPNVTIQYSTNSGTSYSSIGTIDGSYFDGDKVYKLYSYSFPSDISPDAGEKIYIEFVTTSGERMLYDDFQLTYTASGNINPEINNIIYTPSNPTSWVTVSVSADVTDSDGTISTVELHWGLASGSLPNTINMSLSSGNTYTTDSDIPDQTNNATVYFEINAGDNNAGSTTSPEQSYFVFDPTNIIINEIHADPDATNGDANGDGVVNTSQDEFVELVNSSGSDIDLSNYTLSDATGSIRHTFPSGTILQPNDAVVVFGGGTPTGFDYYEVQTATAGFLGLNNGGDDVDIRNANGILVSTYTYGPEGGDNQSLTRDPDVTGSFVKHSIATGSGGALFSPNKFIDGNWFREATAWDGDQADNDWTNAANWSNGVPTDISRVAIPAGLSNYPTITAYAGIINSLYIESDASLIGVGYLSWNGIPVMERQIDTYGTDDDGWHLLSSPVLNFLIAGSDFVPISGNDDLYRWSEPDYLWFNYQNFNFEDDHFEKGRGYLAAYSSSSTKMFYGTPNTVSANSLTYTAGKGEGWNLLGNPFTSAIDWDLVTKSSSHVDASVYVLNGVTGQYDSWNGSTGDLTDGHIPVNNGFFVKTDQAGESITMESADQVHSSQGFLKTTTETPDYTVKVTLSNNVYRSNIYVQFREGATTEFDSDMDAYRLSGTTNGPQLYTFSDERQLSINCLPFSNQVVDMIMGFMNEVSGDYNITSSGHASFSAGFNLFLEDLIDDEIIELTPETVYSFSADAEDEENRFILHFHGVTSVGESPAIKEALIYAHNKMVYVKFNQLPQNNTRVEVFNTLGQQVAAGDMAPATLMQLRLDEKPGIYIVRLRTENGLVTQKVMIK